MKSICFCIKIHIPAVQLGYRLINDHKNYSFDEDFFVRSHLNKVCSENLLPFLETVRSVFIGSEEKFKAGISISGITLSMLQKLRPDVMAHLKFLVRSKNVEILSEPWSNSIVPFTHKSSMTDQLELHDLLVKSEFGVTPSVFIMHSPVSSQEAVKAVFKSGKKGIFAYSNQTSNISSKQRDFYNPAVYSIENIHFINYKLSRIIQDVNFYPDMKFISAFASRMVKKVEKVNAAGVSSIIFYNPVTTKRPFHSNQATAWKSLVMKLMQDHSIQFKLPSETVNEKHKNGLTYGHSDQYKLPDLWLKSNLQKKVFKRLLIINTLMQMQTSNVLIKEWNIIQDMEHLFYMSTDFNKRKFAEHHFNPFPDPEMASVNYMNILDDFEQKLHKKEKGRNKFRFKMNVSNVVNEPG